MSENLGYFITYDSADQEKPFNIFPIAPENPELEIGKSPNQPDVFLPTEIVTHIFKPHSEFEMLLSVLESVSRLYQDDALIYVLVDIINSTAREALKRAAVANPG